MDAGIAYLATQDDTQSWRMETETIYIENISVDTRIIDTNEYLTRHKY